MRDNNENKAVLFSKLFGGDYYQTKGLPPHEIIDFLQDSNGEFYVFLPPHGELDKKDTIRIRTEQAVGNEAKDNLPSVKYMVLTKDGAREGNNIVYVIELAEKLSGDGTNLSYGDDGTNIKELWKAEGGTYATFKGSRIFRAEQPIPQTDFPGQSRLETHTTKPDATGNKRFYPTIYSPHTHYRLIKNANDLETKIEEYIKDGVLKPYSLYDTKKKPIDANSLEAFFKEMYKGVYGKNPPRPQTSPKPLTSPKPARSIREVLSDIFKQIQTIDERRKKLPRLKSNDEAVVRLANKGDGCLFDELAEVLPVPRACELYWNEGSGDANGSFYVLFKPRSAPKDFAKTGTYVSICFGKSTKPGVVAGISCGQKADQPYALKLRTKTGFPVDVGNFNDTFLEGKVREWTSDQLNTDEGVQDFTQWIQTSLNDWFAMKPFNKDDSSPETEGANANSENRPSPGVFQGSDLSSNTPKGPRNCIFFGAPGTGKSHTVDKIVREDATAIRTTFHPDSDYASFVGAYKPTMKNGKIVYEFVPQAFTKAYMRAWEKMAQAEDGKAANTQYLVIEEINRGNCAQIFGDLFQLLDRDDAGYSKYPVAPDTDLGQHLNEWFHGRGTTTDGNSANTASKVNGSERLPFEDTKEKTTWDDVLSGRKLVIPPNLYIWATMNTSDQSLFPMDSAFKRRWDWEYSKIKNEGKDYKIVVNDKEFPWWDFLEKINDVIRGVTQSADKQLGYFFVTLPKDETTIDAKTFVNKVIFYLWNDVFKDCELEGDEYKAFKNGEKEKAPQLTFDDFFDADGNVDEKVVENFLSKLLGKDDKPQGEP